MHFLWWVYREVSVVEGWGIGWKPDYKPWRLDEQWGSRNSGYLHLFWGSRVLWVWEVGGWQGNRSLLK